MQREAAFNAITINKLVGENMLFMRKNRLSGKNTSHVYMLQKYLILSTL
jgi:hypothetical protein